MNYKSVYINSIINGHMKHKKKCVFVKQRETFIQGNTYTNIQLYDITYHITIPTWIPYPNLNKGILNQCYHVEPSHT